MKERQSNLHSEPLLGLILKQLDIAVFEWQESGFFQPLCPLPSWFNQLYLSQSRNSANDGLDYYLGTHFPFIENFLYDAEQVWSETQNTSIRSGLWTEEISEYQELYLEAVALNVESRAILLIINETSNFDLRHKVFQNARNLALKNEKLESSVQEHQRQLQKQLEKLYKQESLEQNQPLPDEIEQESSAVLICKQDGGVEVYNKALIDIYSLNNDDELQQHSLLQKWIKEAEKQYPEIHRVLKSGKHWEGEFETFDAKLAKKWVRLTIAPSTNELGEVQHFICIANDISHIRLSVSEIERLTQIDTTTQLPNRRSFWQYLSTAINKQQAAPTGLALLYLDLDNFRRVNDDLGPKQADFLLNTVATRLKRCLKKNDYVAHLGGDEFAVVIDGFTDQHSLANIAQRVKENIYRDVSFSDFTLNVGTSIGIAVYPQHGVKARQLVKSADYAMYHAKEMGRNQFQFSSPYSRRRIKQKLYIEQGLKEALRNNEFELLFQPQIAIGNTTEHRLEALIRWQHPVKGRITPADFISIAEESGLIVDIGKWVIDSACQQLKALVEKGIKAIVSINVSPKQFKRSDLAKDIFKALKKYEVPANQLELEVTESIFVEEVDQVAKQLQELRKEGISISLDDFGTGYSSLSYLKSLPINILKIDKSFIHELPHNKHSETIVETIINMAHQLSINVIAEGVENEQQLDLLKSLNCDFVQGYLFHAPLDSQQLIDLYRSISIQLPK